MAIIGKQPNGLYCVYGTVTDNIIMFNYTEEELVQEALKEKEKEVREMVAAQIERSEKRYNDILNNLEIHHSKKFAEDWNSEFSKPIQ